MSGKNKKRKQGKQGKGKKSKVIGKITLSSSMREDITTYINDVAKMMEDIKKKGYPLMGKINFVSINDDCVLRILITGSCPASDSVKCLFCQAVLLRSCSSSKFKSWS